MPGSLTIQKQVHFRRGRGSRKILEKGTPPEAGDAGLGNIPRISRLMALAIRFDRLIKSGEVTDQADLARLGHVSRARVTQIMNLLQLAPDIQEEILFLPRTERGRDPIRERMVRPIAAVLDWRKQRRMWEEAVFRPEDGGGRRSPLVAHSGSTDGQVGVQPELTYDLRVDGPRPPSTAGPECRSTPPNGRLQLPHDGDRPPVRPEPGQPVLGNAVA